MPEVLTYPTPYGDIEYEIVTPVDLVPNDVILQHGGVFAVREHRVEPAIPGHASSLPVAVNICEYLADASPNYACQIPNSWRVRWNCQGNTLARVARVLSVPGRAPYGLMRTNLV